MPKLIISGITHDLVDEAITIGRGPDNTIVVNDPSISTHHAQLLLEGDTYRLKDLESTNGTRVNGKPVTETVLRFDDRIRFGAAEARYDSSEVGGSKPLPKPEEIKAHFAEAGAELPHLAGASPFRRQQQENAAGKQANPAQAAHQRYPASVIAWVQLRLTPLAVIRQGTDLLVSLVEPWQILTISRVQALATVTRAAIRFWIASKVCR